MIHSGKPIRRLRVLSLVMSWTAGLAQQTEQVVSFAAESVFLDLQRGNNVFKNISVSDGNITIYAAEGTTTANDANSDSWTLAGSVRVTIRNAGTLIADSAVVRFSEGQLAQGELLGDPVVFETRGEGDDAAFHGTAGRISYDGAQRILSASEGASLVSRGIEVENCNWAYDLDDKSVSGIAEGDDNCLARVAVKRREVL